MRLTDLLRFSTRALTERKLRAVLTIVGIMIGPATIVALSGATQGYSNAATSRFSSLGATSIFVSPVGRGTTLTSADVNTIQGLGGVSYVLPYYELGGQLRQGGQTVGVSIIAADLNTLQQVLPTLSLAEGTVPASSDEVDAVIGYSVAHPDLQGATNYTVGQVLTVSGVGRSSFGVAGAGVFFGGSASTSSAIQRSFVVSGIYSQFGQGFGINPDESVFIPLSAGQLILHSTSYSGLMVVASSAGAVDQVVSEIDSVYSQTVRATSISSLTSTIQSITSGTTTLLEAVAATSILVAFIGIMTTMLTSVIERTKEIGILKALGTSSRGIMATFVTEALVTGVVGGIIGAFVGVGLSYLIISFLSRSTLGLASSGFTFAAGAGGRTAATSATTLTITPYITPEILTIAILLAIAVGTLGGLLPAWRASRMNPVESLKRS